MKREDEREVGRYVGWEDGIGPYEVEVTVDGRL